jgi:hypothetical protein
MPKMTSAPHVFDYGSATKKAIRRLKNSKGGRLQSRVDRAVAQAQAREDPEGNKNHVYVPVVAIYRRRAKKKGSARLAMPGKKMFKSIM